MDETKVAPEVESKETEVTPAEASTDVEQVKVGDESMESVKEQKMVPESVLIEYKKQAKSDRKELDALRKSIEAGATKSEISQSVKEIAEEYNVNIEFANKFASAVKKEVEDSTEDKLKPFKEREVVEKINRVFDTEYERVLVESPEYAKLVNKDVIKSLTLNPKNAGKDLNAKLIAQIFQESYGHLVTGKKTLDTTKPRGGAKDTSIDFEKASKDSTYFAEVMADPTLKAEYNKRLISQNRF